MAAAGNIIRSTVAAPRIPTGLRPIGSAAPREAIPWRIAKQVPDSDNKVELAIALQAGLVTGAESATVVGLGITVVGLEITVVEPETGETTVQALGLATGAPEEQETEQQVRATDPVTGPHPVVVETA